jgi:hypothetical protein
MSEPPRDDEDVVEEDPRDDDVRQAEELEDGSLDPDELTGEPDWWDDGSDDEG